MGPKSTASTGDDRLRLRLGIRDNSGTGLNPNRRVPSVRKVGVILADEFSTDLVAGGMDAIDVRLRGVGGVDLLEVEVPVEGVVPKLLEEVREVGDVGESRAVAAGGVIGDEAVEGVVVGGGDGG